MSVCRDEDFLQKTLQEIRRAYKLLYRSGLNVTQAVQKIKEVGELIPEVEKIVNFIEASERGIIK